MSSSPTPQTNVALTELPAWKALQAHYEKISGVHLRTLFGDVELASPRLHRCQCQDTTGPATVSPLRDLITDHVAPERLYLEARWASLVPYAAAAGLLGDILPIASGANAKTLRKHVLRVAERAEVGLAKERPCFINGCPADWAGLPIP